MRQAAFLLMGLAPILTAGISACGQETKDVDPATVPVPVVTVDTTAGGLIIYYPPTDSIELRCFDRPDPAVDGGIVFCCAAAFTADWGTVPDHARICGDHVSGGRLYRRPRIRRNTGAFLVKDGGYRFIYDRDASPATFRTAFAGASTAFTQEMMVHQGRRVKTTRPDANVNQFRALCEIGTTLCIAESAEALPFGDFIQLLLDAGVIEALYMDMGPGWNYSWYREYPGSDVTWIHSASLSSATNWLVFGPK
jgi:hypothetical protein